MFGLRLELSLEEKENPGSIRALSISFFLLCNNQKGSVCVHSESNRIILSCASWGNRGFKKEKSEVKNTGPWSPKGLLAW